MMSAARRRTLVAAATAAVLAVVILCLAVPRLIGAALLAPGNVPLQLIQSERESSPEGYARIVESRSAALPWMESGRLLTDRALGRQLLARSEADGEPLKPEVLEPIIADLEAGVALAPVNPHAWARLAMMRLEADGPVAPVASAIRMSILTGPHEHEFVFLRLALALSVWSWFGSEDRDLVRDQIRFAWRYSRDDTVDLALRSQRVLVFRVALLNDPKELAEFDKRLARREQ